MSYRGHAHCRAIAEPPVLRETRPSPEWIRIVLKVWQKWDKSERFSLIVLVGCVAVLVTLLMVRL